MSFDLSGLKNLVKMYGEQSKQVSKQFKSLDQILGNLKSQVPQENLEDFNQAFELNKDLKRAFKDGKNPNDLIDKIHEVQRDLKNKYK